MASHILNDLFWLLANLVFTFLGYRIGVSRERLRHRNREPKYICACEHAWSMHKEKGSCNVATVKWEGPVKVATLDCPCVRYQGPVPPEAIMKDFTQ